MTLGSWPIPRPPSPSRWSVPERACLHPLPRRTRVMLARGTADAELALERRRLRRRAPLTASTGVAAGAAIRRRLHEPGRRDAGQHPDAREHPRPPPRERLDVAHQLVAA